MKIRNARKGDLKIIAEIYKIEFSKPPYNENWTTKKALDKMYLFYKDYDLYVILTDNKVIGFIVINPNFMCPGEVAFGEEIAIREDYQNKGVGTKVLKEIFKIYKQKGFKKFMGIADINSRAFTLYHKLGIKPSKKNILIERQL